jgi:hypothetical protein
VRSTMNIDKVGLFRSSLRNIAVPETIVYDR